MKRKYTTSKHKQHVKRRQVHELKSTRAHKDWLTWYHKKQQGKSQVYLQWLNQVQKSHEIIAPRDFSLGEKVNDALAFVTLLKEVSKIYRKIFIKLKNVHNITPGAIAMLLSTINELEENKIKVTGDYPSNKKVRKILDQSGFFNYVSGNVEEENQTTINTILTEGKEVVKPAWTAPIVTSTMQTIYGKPYRNQALQGLLIELMANTVNHAFDRPKDRRWWLSVNHDDVNNRVSFSFVDNGLGIINTLNLKFKQVLSQLLFSDNAQLLSKAFQGEIGSRTKLGNRGRGLPAIYKKYKNGHVANLTVITNDVYLDFSSNKQIKLKNNFNGTYYNWEVDLNCTAWKNI